MEYIYQYDVAAIIIAFAVTVGFITQNNTHTKISRAFFVVSSLVLISSVSDLITIIFIKSPELIPLWFNYLLNGIYILTFNMIPGAYCGLIIIASNEFEKRGIIYKLLLSIPFAIICIFIITSPWTKLIYYFDENQIYTHGKLFNILYVNAIFYVTICFIQTSLHKEILTSDERSTFYFYLIASVIAILVQAVFQRLLIIGFITSITSLLLYLSLENPANFQDKEMGVYNRHAFFSALDNNFNKNKRFKIIGVKIIGLSYLNETIGLENNQQIIKQIGKKFVMAWNKHYVYRLSGTRVAIIIPDNENTMNHVISRIESAFSEPYKIGDIKISISCKLAYINCPDDTNETDDVMDLLDVSLREIEKESEFVIHADTKLMEKSRRENLVRNVLKSALEKKEFFVVYQPIYSLKEKRYTTAEALVRLNTEEIGFIGPDEFIPIAEQNGMILQIGEFVFKTVCEFIKKNKIWELGINHIHVNLSAIQCMQRNLYEQLLKIMDSYELDYNFINLEVTETAMIVSSDILKSNMEKLIEKGINFSLDDFGTGFSNTESLITYPFHTVKIDKTMVNDALENKKAKNILQHSIAMLKELKMEVIAEGIEKQEQIIELEQMNCDLIQGYYYSKPRKSEDFLEFIK